MDNNKGQTIFLSVIGIATLLVAIIGATFAWFSVQVTGNDTASSIFVTTATLGSVTFEDGTQITLGNIRPEDSKKLTNGDDNYASKTFTVAYGGTDALTRDIQYKIYLDVTSNSISTQTGATAWFVHEFVTEATKAVGLTCATDGTATADCVDHRDGLANTKAETLDASGDAGTLIVMSKTAVPSDTGLTQLGDEDHNVGVITKPQTTHTYTYYIHLENVNATQDKVQGQSFVGKLKVETVD